MRGLQAARLAQTVILKKRGIEGALGRDCVQVEVAVDLVELLCVEAVLVRVLLLFDGGDFAVLGGVLGLLDAFEAFGVEVCVGILGELLFLHGLLFNQALFGFYFIRLSVQVVIPVFSFH